MHKTTWLRQQMVFLAITLSACWATATSRYLPGFSPNDTSQYRSPDSIGREYYTIADADEEQAYQFIDPFKLIKLSDSIEQGKIPNEQNLLNWILHSDAQAETPEKYVRKSHFGGWIKDPSGNTCLNIRGLVLKRDALTEVNYDNQNPCRIVSSRWLDPYSGTEITSADDLQIDHFVPLKNAYISGAWQWSASQRCNYANFMGNDFHLLAVSGSENNKKSDSTPVAYLPAERSYICHYLVNWLKIKSIWKLKLAKDEATAIETEIEDNGCDRQEFQISWQELQAQRDKAENTAPATCQHRNSSAGASAGAAPSANPNSNGN